MHAEATPEPEAEFAEVDPTARYGRYSEVLGKGAFKTVYKAFDELEGIEVAWNQVKVVDVLRNSDDLERLYSEVHLLKTLKHKNIIKFYNSWVDTKRNNINLITEVFTSGTLRQYREKHKHVDIRALKNWSRQILSGLDYLHSHNPPVIHRDLKCDNIFVNGNQGEVKIGDLGLAAILRHAHSAHSVIGTPEFMAPELYEEQYNELVDIYAFGMCLLELVTFEYPYAECTNAAQIYKKVTAGSKPASLCKVKDPSVKQFIEKCIANVSERLPARDLLGDPFLQLDLDDESVDNSPEPALYRSDSGGHVHVGNSYACDHVERAIPDRDFTVEGQRKDINTIFMKLRIADSTGQVRNIHFPFDIEADTSISVATEMVAELDLSDQDVTTIAAMIDAEIQVHVLQWMPGEALEDNCSNEVTASDDESEADDELCALPNELDIHGGFVLEWLPSGRKYWSDSPKGTNTDSPLAPTQSNLSSDLNSHDDADDMSRKDYEGTESGFDNDNQRESFSSDISSHSQEKDLSPTNERVEDNPELMESTPLQESSNSSLNDLKNHKQEESLTCIGENQSGVFADQQDGDDESSSKPLFENEHEDVKFIMHKLEHLLVEQRREHDDLKKKHDMAITDILKELPPGLRERTLNMCRLKVSDYKVHS